ncbi:hypothetical protein WN48_00979 [Eufriesea mexicana]|uniref:Uncharacterized protein n=1 Tax=Eufriesea mexicana TaxID=516756 RepID=A0A310SCZ9_9HYME|nr:hypothetical protein WN48_00979 [Eufriesea mexicana]
MSRLIIKMIRLMSRLRSPTKKRYIVVANKYDYIGMLLSLKKIFRDFLPYREANIGASSVNLQK